MAKHTQMPDSMPVSHASYEVPRAQLHTVPTPGHRMLRQPRPEMLPWQSAVNHVLHREAAKGSLGSDTCLFCLHLHSKQVPWPHLAPRGKKVKSYHLSGRTGNTGEQPR